MRSKPPTAATVLKEEGEPIIAVDGGAVVRRFLYSEAEVSFEINTLESARSC